MKLNDVIHTISDAPVIEVSRFTTLWGSVGGVFASMAQWNWTAIIASTVAICGLFINWYFSRRKHKLERVESELRQALIQAQLLALKESCDHVPTQK